MTILPHIPLPCEFAAGPLLLQLLFIWLFLLSGAAYWQVYPWGRA